MDVGRVVFGDHITTRHAVAAVMTRGTSVSGYRQSGLSYVNHLYPKFLCPAPDQQIALFHGDRRQKDAIREIAQAVRISAYAHFPLYSLVIRSKVVIVDGPVFACTFKRSALEVPLTLAPRHGIPQHGFAADATGALRLESRFAGLHHGDVAIRE